MLEAPTAGSVLLGWCSSENGRDMGFCVLLVPLFPLGHSAVFASNFFSCRFLAFYSCSFSAIRQIDIKTRNSVLLRLVI
jgi:hypothetical protein